MRVAMLLLLIPVTLSSGEPEMPGPKYTASGRLARTEGWREWMFVGANLGMGYTEGQEKPRMNYHNIYVQRDAHRYFRKNRKFPDKTMMVMEVFEKGTKESINRLGSFEAAPIGIEVALKDEKRFPEKWAYFNFIGEGGKPMADSAPFRKEACWSCHNQHGAADNVFVQFYPVLREALP